MEITKQQEQQLDEFIVGFICFPWDRSLRGRVFTQVKDRIYEVLGVTVKQDGEQK